MDPLTRWYADPASKDIEKFAKRVLLEISATIPRQNADLIDLSQCVYYDIDTLRCMPGESLYWRYTLAIKLVNVEGWRFATYDETGAGTWNPRTEEPARLLDAQLEGILREGQHKKGALPYVQAMIALGITQTASYYPLSWAFLESLGIDLQNMR
jgi:hypothetical protein